MRSILLAGLLLLGGCAAAQDPASKQPEGGGAALTAVATPFLYVAKLPVCVLTLVVAGPVGALAQLSDPENKDGYGVRQGLADGIGENCGPPYVVTP